MPGASPSLTEDEARGLFDGAALAWIASLGTLLASNEDVAWFARRPEAMVRLRPADAAEIAGRPSGVWVTFMFRDDAAPYGLGRLCLDERTLGRDERSQAGLMRILRDRVRSLAAGEVLAAAPSYLPPPVVRKRYAPVKSGARAVPLHAGRKDVQQARAAIRRLTGRTEPKSQATLINPIPNAVEQVPAKAIPPEVIAPALPKGTTTHSGDLGGQRSVPALPAAMVAVGPISPQQCRAARGWLGWSQRELSVRCLLAVGTIVGFEKGQRTLFRNNATALARVFQEAGVTLIFDADNHPVGISVRSPHSDDRLPRAEA